MNNFCEISFDYTDDKGVTHIDAYTSEESEGQCIGFIFNGEAYFKDNDMRADKFIMEAVKEHLTNAKADTTPTAYDHYLFANILVEALKEEENEGKELADVATYDEIWGVVEPRVKDYESSDHNNDNLPVYECMVNYVKANIVAIKEEMLQSIDPIARP